MSGGSLVASARERAVDEGGRMLGHFPGVPLPAGCETATGEGREEH